MNYVSQAISRHSTKEVMGSALSRQTGNSIISKGKQID